MKRWWEKLEEWFWKRRMQRRLGTQTIHIDHSHLLCRAYSKVNHEYHA